MLIDSHCHLPHPNYEKSVDEIVKEAKDEGVGKIINIGTSIQDSKDAFEVAKKYENVYSTVAVYPHDDIGMGLNEIREELERLINDKESAKNIVGIGECGIDIPHGDASYKTRSLEDQKELFKMQIGLALQYDLPLIIHNRDGDKDVLEVLEHYKDTNFKGIMHCYVSDWEYAQKLFDLNFHISFTAIVTYPSAGKGLIETVKNVPSDKFLIETDAPYLAPQGLRGQINYPKYVKITAEKIAMIRNCSFEEIEEITYRNTCQLFNI